MPKRRLRHSRPLPNGQRVFAPHRPCEMSAAAKTRTKRRADPGRLRLARLVAELGGRYSTALGIDLSSGKPGEIYKWFLAAILYGARISEIIASNTYREFARARVLSPQAVIRTGWDRLVEILDRGGYVRYDYKTATKLLAINRNLVECYAGDLNVLHAAARDARDLEQRIKALGKGIGDVTAGIFLRELRRIWSKADPPPSALVLLAARRLGLLARGPQTAQRALASLRSAWRRARVTTRYDFSDFEAVLVRYGCELRRSPNKSRAGARLTSTWRRTARPIPLISTT
jgi:hypothetical protein